MTLFEIALLTIEIITVCYQDQSDKKILQFEKVT